MMTIMKMMMTTRARGSNPGKEVARKARKNDIKMHHRRCTSRKQQQKHNRVVYLGVFSGDFFVEFALREVPERGTNWCAHDVFERDVPFRLVVVKKIEVV